MSIVIIKTITGEELIATRNESSLGKVTYSKTRVFRVVDMGNGQGKAELFPFWIVAPDVEFEMNQALVFAEIPAPDAVERSYLQSTTGIALVGGK
jgi:hypothetical protein